LKYFGALTPTASVRVSILLCSHCSEFICGEGLLEEW